MIFLTFQPFCVEKLVKNKLQLAKGFKKFSIVCIVAACAALSSCKKEEKDGVKMPKPKKVPHSYEMHEVELVDNYHWLRDNNWPKVEDKEVLAYLNEENEYFEHNIKDIESQQETIFHELKGRIKEDDESVPTKEDDYYYYHFIRKGQSYHTFARKHKSLSADPEVILDQNALAKEHEHFALGSISTSPNHRYLAYSADVKGDERYTIRVKDLEKHEMLDDEIPNTISSIIWHESGNGFFYLKVNEKWRHQDVYYHTLGTPKAQDMLVYHEDDETFAVTVNKTGSKEYIVISTSSRLETEKYYLSAKEEDFKPKLIKAREKDIRFSLTHKDKYFYFNINDKGNNFRVVRVPVSALEESGWTNNWEQYAEEIFAHSAEKYIESFFARKNYFTMESKVRGLPKLEIFNSKLKKIKEITFADEAYESGAMYTAFDQDVLRYTYSSLRTPSQVLEYNLDTGKTVVLKEQEIPSGFESSHYKLQRKWIKARDGEMVPITILYSKNHLKEDGNNPLYLYGYGSYGMSVPLRFRTSIFSLVDRGFVYVIAGIRGGDDLGLDWHEQAKFTKKKVTFFDFIDVANYLVESNYTTEGNITIVGGSAGGMLVGYCLNERPQLYKAAVMHVPFVDVLNTMLDETLPLTAGEFKEWGNPKEKEIFDYMLTYSPYENIKEQNYPSIFVTAGLSDPRVTYWEPAKYVAKLREYKTDNNLLLLKTNMGAGHQGKTGRYDQLHEVAEEFNVILNLFYQEGDEQEKEKVEEQEAVEQIQEVEQEINSSETLEEAENAKKAEPETTENATDNVTLESDIHSHKQQDQEIAK